MKKLPKMFSALTLLSCLSFCSIARSQTPTAPAITSVVNPATNTITVTISEADPSYEVHYTTDGTAPSSTSALYVAPIVLSKSATVKAIAVVIPATAISSSDFTITPLATTFAFKLGANKSSLAFTYQLGATSSAAQSLVVWDSSPCPPVPPVVLCNWPVTATTDVAWLTATSGTTGFTSSVALNTSKLTAVGTFTGNVILTQPQFTTPTLKIPVTVTVSAAAAATPPPLHSVSLTWTAPSSPVAGFNVMRAAISGGPYANLAYVTGPLYLDTAVIAGATYFYVVESVNASGDASANSTQVAAAIPTP
jgi:Fn3 associated